VQIKLGVCMCFRLLSKNLKFRIYKTIILPTLSYGCETWSLILREEHRLRLCEKNIWTWVAEVVEAGKGYIIMNFITSTFEQLRWYPLTHQHSVNGKHTCRISREDEFHHLVKCQVPAFIAPFGPVQTSWRCLRNKGFVTQQVHSSLRNDHR
jgi:hypothetical protein